MKSRMLLSAILSLWMVSASQAADPAAVPDPQTKIKLRVLYTGVPGEARTADFLELLNKHFTKVGEASYVDFEPKMADGYDVVIVDAEAKPTPGHIGLPKMKKPVPITYGRATVLIGGGGAMPFLHLHTKIDWLCLCLEKGAHDMELKHEIFHKPFEVDITYDTFPATEEYRHFGIKPGRPDESLECADQVFLDWTNPEARSGVHGRRLRRFPRCRVDFRRHQSQVADAVAIGRHGTFFHWGFSASHQKT